MIFKKPCKGLGSIKETTVSLLGFPVAGNNTTTLLVFFFHAFMSVSVNLFWGFQKYYGPLNVDRLPQEWVWPIQWHVPYCHYCDPSSRLRLSRPEKVWSTLDSAGWDSHGDNSKNMCSRQPRPIDNSRPGFRCNEAQGHPLSHMLFVWGYMISTLILQCFQNLW